MAITVPTAADALPPAPSTAEPASFDALADAFLGAIDTFRTQENALAAVNYGNATEAFNNAVISQNSAGTAQAAAAAAQSSAGAPVWVSGTSYTIGQAAYSPITMRIYRRLTNGAGTTDPSADGTNWQGISTDLTVAVVSGTTQTAVAGTHYTLANGSATTVTLPASPQSGDTVWVTVANGLDTNVIARNGNTIMGSADDLTISNPYATIKLRYVNTTWRLI